MMVLMRFHSEIVRSMTMRVTIASSWEDFKLLALAMGEEYKKLKISSLTVGSNNKGTKML